MTRSTLIFVAVSLGFFFVTATTFTSLGYVLYTMVDDLGWSQVAAGMGFSILGLACGLSSPLPPFIMKWVGTRLTMFIGSLVLAAGFLLAATIDRIEYFFLATTLMGAGFSLIAPSPAVYLLATWFPDRSARLMGYYFMAGSFGGVVGPLIVGAIVTLTGSWRVHWFLMALAALVLGVLFLLCIRDKVRVETVEQVKAAGGGGRREGDLAPDWTVRRALASPIFIQIAFAMLVVQTVVTTMHSTLVAHVAALGHGSASGAFAMSLLALAGTLSKGVTGVLSERLSAKLLLVGGLCLQCFAMLALGSISTPAMIYLTALLFGTGWGFGWLAAHILLLRYFGAAIAGEMVAMATMATTAAVLGPLYAGYIADTQGGFSPAFMSFALLLGLAALVAMLLPAVRSAPSREVESALPADPGLSPAE